MGYGGAEGWHSDQTGGGGTIGGGGTPNYVAKFTPDGTHIGDSLLFDNGASVAIGTAAPNASALFQLESTTQGFLTPRMTTLQRNAIAAPATGLLIYNTGTSLFNYWDGAAWQEIDSNATSEWLLDGNTNGAVKYIGTNDAFDFPIYTNGIQRAVILSTGEFGINIALPTAQFHVQGSGATFATTNLLLQASTTSVIHEIKDDGQTGIGGAAINGEMLKVYGRATTSEYIASFYGGAVAAMIIRGHATLGGNVGIGINPPGATIRLHVQGFGSTGATNGLTVQDSLLNEWFSVKDNGQIVAGAQAGANQGSMVMGYGTSNMSTLDINNTIFGVFAGGLLTGNRNTAFGTSAMASAVGADRNSAFGNGALGTLTTGFGNTGIGWSSVSGMTNASYITGVGFAALSANNSTGSTALGAIAASNSTGSNITAIGYQAMEFNTTGNSLVAVGTNAMRRNVTGSRNTVLGDQAGEFNVAAGSDNIFIGYLAGYFNNDAGDGTGTIGSIENVIIGTQAGSGFTGNGSVIIGFQANINSILQDDILYIDNGNNAIPLIFGDFASRELGFGTATPTATVHVQGATSDNTAYAFKIDNSILTGLLYVRNDGFIGAGSVAGANEGSMIIGFNATDLSATGLYNTVLGVYAAPGLTGNRNTVLGTSAMASATTASRNIVVGNGAGQSMSNDFGHVAIGWSALQSMTGANSTADAAMNVAIGYQSLVSNVIGEGNTAVGSNTLVVNTGNFNTAIGGGALKSSAAADSNTALGYGAGPLNVTGTRNAFIGFFAGLYNIAAGSDNVFVGSNSGQYNNDTGNPAGTIGRSQNTFIGAFSGQAFTGSASVIIGYQVAASALNGTNMLAIDNADNAIPLIYGDFSTRELGFGTITPTGRVHAFGMVSNVTQRLEPVSGSWEDTSGGSGTTSGAVTADIQTIAIPTDTGVSIECVINYKKTAGAGLGTVNQASTFKLNGTANNIGGVVTLGTVQNTYTDIINAIIGVSATFVVSATNIIVRVTGVLNDDISYNVVTKTSQI